MSSPGMAREEHQGVHARLRGLCVHTLMSRRSRYTKHRAILVEMAGTSPAMTTGSVKLNGNAVDAQNPVREPAETPAHRSVAGAGRCGAGGARRKRGARGTPPARPQ